MARRVLVFPLTRLLIALGLFYALWQTFDLVYLMALGRPPSGLIDRAAVTAAALAALFFVGGRVERRRPSELGFARRGALADLGLGLLLGAVLLTVIAGTMALAGWYRVVGFLWDQPNGSAAYVAIVGLAYYALVAVSEETLFRGIGFRIVEEGLGTWAALAVSAVLFGLAHLGNSNATLWSALALALESGILFAAGYVLTRALWLPIGLHLAWNYFLGIVYGMPVSGSSQSSLLQSVVAGPDLWTGGAFGPEAGLIAVILAGGLGVLMLILCARQKKILTPGWLRRAAVNRAREDDHLSARLVGSR
jgi:CAAX protease family protein